MINSVKHLLPSHGDTGDPGGNPGGNPGDGLGDNPQRFTGIHTKCHVNVRVL